MLIGLHGKKRSGKDTAAKYISEVWPESNVKRFAFADNIRYMALESAPFSIREVVFYDDLLGEGRLDRDTENIFELSDIPESQRTTKIYMWINRFCQLIAARGFKQHSEVADFTHIKTIRDLLVFFGTEIGRDCFDQQLWLKLVEQDIIRHRGLSIITDVRFDNEALMVRGHQGIVAQIERSDQEDQKSDHRSEEGISPKLVDCVIRNEYGNIEDFYDSLDHFVDRIRGHKIAI